MSELTSCNFCNLLRLKENAKRKGWRITLKPTPQDIWPKGQDVYMHPPRARLVKRYWVAWFAELTDHCVC